MLGEESGNPKDVVGQMEEFLYVLNLLNCAEPTCMLACSCMRLMMTGNRDLSELSSPASTSWVSLHAAIEADSNQARQVP